MAICPNKNLEDWQELVKILGEDGAYFVFIKNGNKVPYLQGRESNRYIWDVENKLGLITWKNENGKNTKLYKGYSSYEAAQLTAQIRDEYVGDYHIAQIQPDTRGDLGLQIIGYPLPKKEVERHAAEYSKSMNEAIEDYKEYQDFKQREEEANEDLIPLEAYEQRDILYNKKEYGYENDAEREAALKERDLESILRQAFPHIREVIYDRNLPVNGTIEGTTVRVNPDTMTRSTLTHEFGHLLIDLRGGLSNKFIRQAVDSLKTTPLWEEIQEKYKDQTLEVQEKELLAEAIGREAADMYKSDEQKQEWHKWLIRFFRWLGTRLGIGKDTARGLAKMLVTERPYDTKDVRGVEGMYEQRELTEVVDEKPEGVNPDGVISDKDWEANREERLSLALEQATETPIQALRSKAADIVSTRIRKAKSTGRADDIAALEEVFVTLEKVEIDDRTALAKFVNNAMQYINGTYSAYEDMLAEEKLNLDKGKFDAEPVIKIHTLVRWHDILASYDILDDITQEMLNAHATKVTKSDLKRMREEINEVINRKNVLKDLYKTRGADMLSDILEGYSSRIIIETRENKRKEYKANNPKGNLKLSEWEKAADKYAEEYIEKNIAKLQKDTRTMLRNEMRIASEDIGLLGRWLDTVLDSHDAVVASMVKKFVVQDRIARQQTLRWRDKAWPLVKKLYAKVGYVYGKTPPSKVYDFMLEKDKNGKRTGYLLSQFHSSMMAEYREVIKKTAHLGKAEQRKQLNKWKEDNMPLDRVEKEVALRSYMQELKKKGLLTELGVNDYFFNQQYAVWDRLDTTQIPSIPTETAHMIDKWQQDNSMSFRKPIDKWKDKRWDAFKEMLEKQPDSPEAQFYNIITKELKVVDSALPFAKKKFDELPFQLKRTDERIAAGQKVGTIAKEKLKDTFTRRIDETERGQYTDENDKPIDYMPWYYQRPGETFEHTFTYQIKSDTGVLSKTKKSRITAKTGEEARAMFDRMHKDAVNVKSLEVRPREWTDEDQSYDLMGLYYNYFKMAHRYSAMQDVLPEMELTKRLLENRKYTVTDSKGNKVQRVINEMRTKALTKEGAKSFIAQQFEDFMKAQAYGQKQADEGETSFMGMKFDIAKLADLLAKYSSYNMLGLNAIQGIANVSVGELQQVTEAFAGEYFTTSDLRKASVKYTELLPENLGDIGEDVPTSKLGKLLEKWDILNEYEGGNYKANSKFARSMNTSALFFISHMGEHFMQARVMLAMLGKVRAKNSEGEDIGSMLDMYYTTKSGELKLKDEVDLEQSNWTAEKDALWGEKVKRLLAKLHGEYSDLGKNAAQRHSVGKLGLMFRKFIVPGVKKRWQKKRANEFLEAHTEGSYRSMFKFMHRSIVETRALGLNSMSENWNMMEPRERANVIRAVSELAFAAVISIMATAFMTLKGEADDDAERRLYAGLTYMAERVSTEFLFFIHPGEAMTILKNPAVSTTIIENSIKLFGQMFHPTETYERGSWEGYPKIAKTAINLMPVVKQAYKIKNIEDSLTFFVR